MVEPEDLAILFERAPIVETRASIQFSPLLGFRSGHFGLFWEKCLSAEDWRILKDASLEPKIIEQFGDKRLRPSIDEGLDDVPKVRIRLSRKDKTRLVQFQPNKLLYSWLRADAKQPIESVKGEFGGLWDRLQLFVTEQELGKLEPDLWELGYVCTVPPGALWTTPADWSQVFPGLFVVIVHAAAEAGTVDGARYVGCGRLRLGVV